MIFAEFFHEDGRPAVGDRSVCILDARFHRERQEAGAREHGRRHGFSFFRLASGTILDSKPLTPMLSVGDFPNVVYFSIRDLMEEFRISRTSVKRAIADGELFAIEYQKKLLFHPNEVERFRKVAKRHKKYGTMTDEQLEAQKLREREQSRNSHNRAQHRKIKHEAGLARCKKPS